MIIISLIGQAFLQWVSYIQTVHFSWRIIKRDRMVSQEASISNCLR